MKTDKIIVTTPSGKEIEILSKQEYFNWCMTGDINSSDMKDKWKNRWSSVSIPMSHDYNNWTHALIKDKNLYENLSKEDRIFIMNQQNIHY